MGEISLIQQLERDLSDQERAALHNIESLAGRQRFDVYLVGGAVRDLLLAAAHFDIDLVIEGDAIAIAIEASRHQQLRVTCHKRFGTAALHGNHFRIDLAQARAERYERPGALPSVRPGTLADDLARRDFTINAIALGLTGTHRGRLTDPHGGRADLDAGLVRVLHKGSFIEDATRMLRATRYAARFGFAIESETQRLIDRDRSSLDYIGGARLRREFEAIALERQPAPALELADALGLLEGVHPALRVGRSARQAAASLPGTPSSHRDALLFCVLVGDRDAEAAIARLHLTGRQADAVRSCNRLLVEEERIAQLARLSAVSALLEPHSTLGIEAFALLAADARAVSKARRFLDEWRLLRPRLNGSDLLALGVSAGPDVGRMLETLRRARLDGEAADRAAEEELVRASITERKAVHAG
jgi:tRNA nucleotidyltransferase (CCA-adding enzyme)